MFYPKSRLICCRQVLWNEQDDTSVRNINWNRACSKHCKKWKVFAWVFSSILRSLSWGTDTDLKFLFTFSAVSPEPAMSVTGRVAFACAARRQRNREASFTPEPRQPIHLASLGSPHLQMKEDQCDKANEPLFMINEFHNVLSSQCCRARMGHEGAKEATEIAPTKRGYRNPRKKVKCPIKLL